MTITIDNNCTSFLVQSTSFNAPNISNSLSIKVNEAEPIILALAANAASYTVTPTILNVTEFVEGVYEVELTSILSNSTVSKDKGCAPIICKLRCSPETIALYKDDTKIIKVLALEGLLAAKDCVTCSCQVMKEFINIINDDESTCPCGCCGA